MPYKFLEDVAIADVAFEASGKNLKELFESAALAVINTQIRNLDKIQQKVTKIIKVEAENVEMLLFNFLQEVIFYKDAKQLIFNKFKISIAQEENKWKLTAKASGEKLDMKKHEMVVDVKAVTMHNYEVKETKNGWKTRVILDI